MTTHNDQQKPIDKLCNELIAVLVRYEMVIQNPNLSNQVKELQHKIIKLQNDIKTESGEEHGES